MSFLRIFPYKVEPHFQKTKSMKREDGKFSVEGVISFCRFAETMLPRKCRVSSVRRVAVKENFCCKIFAKLFIHSIHCMRQGWRRSEQAPWGSRTTLWRQPRPPQFVSRAPTKCLFITNINHTTLICYQAQIALSLSQTVIVIDIFEKRQLFQI